MKGGNGFLRGKWNFSVMVECVDRKKNFKREGNLSLRMGPARLKHESMGSKQD